MSLKNLKNLDESEKSKLLQEFLEASEDKKFGQDMVALYLDCSPWTLAKMRCIGSDLPYTKIGRRVAYRKADVLSFERSKTVTCTAQYTS